MRGYVPPDPAGGVSDIQYAVVYEPKRNKKTKRESKRDNKRFSANCVEVKSSEEEALAEVDETSNRFAAKVLGPSKSSEGQIIYYLVEWLV
ncbi:MAG: hypothetical protein GKR92_04640 [Gammaproteobacteria bacterium]|nr:MAG: hypothetical protein GKR92_04640 [Gammaproteobacteria bacterium]